VHERVEAIRAFALIRVASHQHDCDVRVSPARREREFDAIHSRHLYVAQKQIEFAVE
jgi:hypothetical protein